MFEGIGNIGTYAKMQMMRQRAQKNIDTGFAFTKTGDDQQGFGQFKINVSKPKNTNTNPLRLKIIKGKLSRGKKLSQGDLDYLRQNAPQIYTKALKITQDRGELERRLKNCKTKEEAMEVRRSFVSSSATPSVTGGGDCGGSGEISGGTVATDAGVITASGDCTPTASADVSAEPCAAASALAGSGEAAVVSLNEDTPAANTAASYNANGSAVSSGISSSFSVSNQNDELELPEEILRQRAFEDAWQDYTSGKKYRNLAVSEQELSKRKKRHKISIEI